jgi:subtilisin family serine protease
VRRLLLGPLVALVLFAPPVGASGGTDPARPLQWHLDAVHAPAAWRASVGSGVVVAVIDSGVDLGHEDLAGQLVPGHDVVDHDEDPQDAHGHGTHIAGLIAAVSGNGKGGAGIAPGARVMPVRVLDAKGDGQLGDVVEGIRWAVQHGAKVVNLSLAENTQSLGPDLSAVLRETWDAGVVPVVAAGNNTLAGFEDEPALVVSATNRRDDRPSYSIGVGNARWGMAAPGGELPDLGRDGAILSTYWTGAKPNQYAYLAGTSQAAALVSGALALLLSTGRFTPEQAVHRLLETAVDLGPPGRDSTFGTGRLDVGAALAGVGPAQAPGPVATTTSTTTAAPPTTTSTTSTTSTTALTVEIEDDPSTSRHAAPVLAAHHRSVAGPGWAATAVLLLAWGALGATAFRKRRA